MKSKLLLALMIVVSVLIIACERRGREFAGVSSSETKYPTEGAVVEATTVAAVNVSEVAPKVAGELDGKALYAANCAACHQAGGTGVPGAFPPLVNSPYVVGDNVQRLAAIMIYGLQGPINVLGTTYNSVMVGLGGALKDDELAAIATYVRSAWGNSASAVEASVFSESRATHGTRAMFTISELGEEK